MSADITGDGKINENDINSMVNYIVYGRFNKNKEMQEREVVPVKGPKIEVVSGMEGVQGRYISNVTVKISQEKQQAKVAKTMYTIMGTKTTEEIEIEEEEQIELTQAGVYKITSYNYALEGNK